MTDLMDQRAWESFFHAFEVAMRDPNVDREAMAHLLDSMEDARSAVIESTTPPAPVEPPKGSYADYLDSPEWQARRRETLIRDGFKCASCGARSRLHIHHLTYARRGHEHPDDLVTLCADCHSAWHAKGKK